MKESLENETPLYRRRFVAAVQVLVFLSFLSTSSASSESIDVVKVRIADYGNGNVTRLLLLEAGRHLAELSRDILPVWMTLDAPASSSSITGFDMLITSDEEYLRKLQEGGVSMDCRPIFLDELILVGPGTAPLPKSVPVEVVLRGIHAGGLPFFSLMRDEWVEACERNLWKRSGIGRPQENRSYVESGRDEVSALMQSSDEGAFLLVSESAFAAYQDAQRDAPNLSKFAGSGLFRTCYACVVQTGAKSRMKRRSGAALYAAWLESPAGRSFAEDFSLGGVNPFRVPQDGASSSVPREDR